MLLIELNEFNPALLHEASEKFSLENLSYLLSLPQTDCTAPEKQERHGLDPWVQWVSIHTGKTAGEHGIHHLAEADKLNALQIWDVLAERGISCGVWGAMNGKYRISESCKFFFPDPWNYTESAFPGELNGLLALPRYYSKNYLDIKPWQLFAGVTKTMGYLLGKGHKLLPHALPLLKSMPYLKLSNAALFAYFDFLNIVLFSHYRAKFQTSFNLVFLNSVAHYQHHRWPGDEGFSHFDKFFFYLLDFGLGMLIRETNTDDPIVMANAFSQENTSHKNETLYRQIDPDAFFNMLPIGVFELNQLMTNDSLLIFNDVGECNVAKNVIDGIRLGNQSAFETQVRSDSPNRLFCQFLIWESIPPGAVLKVNENI